MFGADSLDAGLALTLAERQGLGDEAQQGIARPVIALHLVLRAGHGRDDDTCLESPARWAGRILTSLDPDARRNVFAERAASRKSRGRRRGVERRDASDVGGWSS
jgi:hypothetical protein